MNGVLLKVGQFPVYTLSFFVVLGFLWFGFVVYKKGLEYHYRDESLFDLVIMASVFGWILARLGYVLLNLDIFSQNFLRVILLTDYPGYNFVGLLLGVVLASFLLSRQGELKFYEGLDLSGLGLMAALAIEQIGVVIAGAGEGVKLGSLGLAPKELGSALVFLLCFVWLWRLEREYRTFNWYRYRRTQARSGFVFGMYLVFLGLTLALFSFVPKLAEMTLILGIASLVLGAIFIYWRSGRVLAHDVKTLIKKRPLVYTSLK